MDDKPLNEPFLSRWSRRKLEAKDESPAAEEPPVSPAAAPGTQAVAAAPGNSAEYREFFDPRVEEKLRRAALKKVFGEPQFNVMDGLDTYIDDYSKPDPIPESMMRQLNQAKSLFLFDEEKKDADAGDPNATAPAASSELSPPQAVAIAPPAAPAASAAEQDKDANPSATGDAPAASSKND